MVDAADFQGGDAAAFQDGDNNIPIRYRFDWKLFNLSRLQAKSKVQTEVLNEFLFVDDMTDAKRCRSNI